MDRKGGGYQVYIFRHVYKPLIAILLIVMIMRDIIEVHKKDKNEDNYIEKHKNETIEHWQFLFSNSYFDTMTIIIT